MSARTLALAALALLGAALVALVALLLALPHLADRPELRRLAEESAARALGRPIGYGRPAIGLFPPALVLERPWIGAAEEGGERLLEAVSLALEIAPWPLLERRIVVRRVAVDGLVLRVARDADGLELPPLPVPGASRGGAAALPRVELHRATIVLRDSTLSPAVTTELRDLSLELAPAEPGAPVALRGSFALGDGRVELAGSAGADGALDLELGLDAVSAGPHAAYLGLAPDALAARVDAALRVRRAAGAALGVEGRLALRDGGVLVGDLAISGPTELRVALDGIPDAPSGGLELDATAAAVARSGLLAKPPGQPGLLSVELRPAAPGGYAFERARLRLGELRSEGSASFDARGLRIELASDWVAAASAAAIFPALASLPGLQGSLRIDELRIGTRPKLRVGLRQSLRDGGVRVGALETRGDASLSFTLASADPVAGTVAIDATGSSVALGDRVAKPVGMPAQLASQVEIGASGSVALRDARIEVAGVVVEGAGELVGDDLRADLRTGSVDASAAASFLPDLASVPGIGGAFALRSLHVETDPLVVLADVDLESLSLAPGTPEPLRVRGPISLRGQTARADRLAVWIGGQPMTVEGEVQLGDAPTYRVHAALAGVDAKAFLRGILPQPPALEGRLDLDADLHGPLDSPSLLDSVEGRLRIHVADGRIPGVSILEGALAALSALDRLGGLARLPGLGAGATGGRAGDRFERLGATVQQARGVSRTDDLRIAYPTYDLALAGELRLSEGTLRMRGDILLGQALLGPVAKGLGLLHLGCAMPNRIPIPEVSGPLSGPRVRPDAAYLLGFATRCSPLGALERVGKGILE